MGDPTQFTTDVFQRADAFSIFLTGDRGATDAGREAGGRVVGFDFELLGAGKEAFSPFGVPSQQAPLPSSLFLLALALVGLPLARRLAR